MSCDKQSANQVRNVFATRNPGTRRYEADDWSTARRPDPGRRVREARTTRRAVWRGGHVHRRSGPQHRAQGKPKLTQRNGVARPNASATLTARRVPQSAARPPGTATRAATRGGANGATARRAVKQGKEGHVLARHGGQSAGAMRRERGATARRVRCGRAPAKRGAKGRAASVVRHGATRHERGYGKARAVGQGNLRYVLARTGATARRVRCGRAPARRGAKGRVAGCDTARQGAQNAARTGLRRCARGTAGQRATRPGAARYDAAGRSKTRHERGPRQDARGAAG